LVGKSRRYQPTPNGLKMVSGLVVLRERVLEPLTRGILNPEPTGQPPTQHLWIAAIEVCVNRCWSSFANLGSPLKAGHRQEIVDVLGLTA
jgi:hypothetical protein